MKFERTVQVRTPDGVDHPNAEAARAHMFVLNFGILGNATSAEFQEAVATQTPEPGSRTAMLREAIREMFLATWPRASKGKPRAGKGEPEPGAGAGGEPSSAPQPETGETNEQPVGTEPEKAPGPEPEPDAPAETATRSSKKKGH